MDMGSSFSPYGSMLASSASLPHCLNVHTESSVIASRAARPSGERAEPLMAWRRGVQADRDAIPSLQIMGIPPS
jgi:hypothetical protein